jgi:hypothetical protein
MGKPLIEFCNRKVEPAPQLRFTSLILSIYHRSRFVAINIIILRSTIFVRDFPTAYPGYLTKIGWLYFGYKRAVVLIGMPSEERYE